MNKVLAARSRLRAQIINTLRDRLRRHPPPDVRAVLLFGSVARNDFDGFSDIDLLVIGPDTLDRSLFDGLNRSVDILPVTPAQAADPQGTVARALAEGVLLHGAIPTA